MRMNYKMKAYLAIKYQEDNSNKELIEDICRELALEKIDVKVMIRDHEKWGKVSLTPKELMKLTFKEIDKADFLLIEFSEKGVGLGIEAGYAYSQNKPIIVIAKKGSEISSTLQGIAKKIIFYENIRGIGNKLK
jgi:nucleoside 2-deoxyribosyltransferase